MGPEGDSLAAEEAQYGLPESGSAANRREQKVLFRPRQQRLRGVRMALPSDKMLWHGLSFLTVGKMKKQCGTFLNTGKFSATADTLCVVTSYIFVRFVWPASKSLLSLTGSRPGGKLFADFQQVFSAWVQKILPLLVEKTHHSINFSRLYQECRMTF